MLNAMDKKLLRDLWKIKGQALAITLVIGAGIALFVMSQGMLVSLEQTMQAFYDRYRFAHVYAPVKRAPEHLLHDIKSIDGVADVEGRISGAGLIDLSDVSAPISARMVSYDPTVVSPINRVHLSEGRMIRPGHASEVLLLKPFADARGFEPGDSIEITMNGVRHAFEIAGLAYSPEFIYIIPPGEFVTDTGRFAILWANPEAMEAAFDADGAFNEVIATVSRGANVAGVLESLDRLLSPYGATGAYDRSDHVSNKYLVEQLDEMSTMGRVMTPIFLGVSIFLLNIVIVRMVMREREEIGLLKAFGYSNWQVGFHYLKFALIIAVFGAVVGWIGGLWLGRMIAEIFALYFHFPFLIFIAEIRMLGVAVLLSAAASVLGAFVAVRTAVRLMPAEAMRPAAPTVYARGGRFGRILERLLDQPSRMIVRRLSRQPMRAVMTIVGIGAAMGLSVMMRFNTNATDYMLETSFNVVDRSDVVVTFVEPLSTKAGIELQRIDGVTYVEPSREVPVLFVSEREERLGSITGLPETPILNRALDEEMRPVDVSGNGIVLSQQLADTLGLKVGETVTVEVREGRRPVLDLPVTGLVDALIGTPAYMNRAALNRALNEPNRITGAYLKIHPDLKEDLYDELKAIPKVAGVSLHREAYENFKRLIDEGPGTFRAIMTVFSIIIAAGVVYNSARIAFIERAHDLASLRVLGFTKTETGYVLLGEIAVLAILALPLGSFLGYGIWIYLANELSTDLYQIPVVYREDGLGYAAIIVLVSALVSGALVQWDVGRLKIVSALKIRE